LLKGKNRQINRQTDRLIELLTICNFSFYISEKLIDTQSDPNLVIRM